MDQILLYSSIASAKTPARPAAATATGPVRLAPPVLLFEAFEGAALLFAAPAPLLTDVEAEGGAETPGGAVAAEEAALEVAVLSEASPAGRLLNSSDEVYVVH